MSSPPPGSIGEQIFWLFVLAIPVATIARTVTSEEVFREPREWCLNQSRLCRSIFLRKFFYLFTCEYCFSHWVALFFLALTGFKLLIDDWRGYIVSWFAVVFVANIYLSLFARLRIDITSEKKSIETKEKQIEKIEVEIDQSKSSTR